MWNDVSAYSPADETSYLENARTLAADPGGYRALVGRFFDDAREQIHPPPIRWANVAIQAAGCVVAPCGYRTLAWVQTLCGILAIVLAYLVARRLLGTGPALLAAALMATAPIQLAMGRRALADMLFLDAFLVALWAILRVASPLTRRRAPVAYGVLLAALVFGFGVKEVFAMYYPALFAVVAVLRCDLRPRAADLVAFGLAPLVYAAIFGLLSGEPGRLMEFVGVWRAGAANAYVVAFQSGPPFEPLVDVYLLAPVVTVLALAAGGVAFVRHRGTDHGAWALTVCALFLFAAYAVIPKDARYFIAADVAFRMLAAWLVVAVVPAARLAVAAAVVALNGLLELGIFQVVFVRGAVYDPVLAELLRALGAIPR